MGLYRSLKIVFKNNEKYKCFILVGLEYLFQEEDVLIACIGKETGWYETLYFIDEVQT